MEVPRIRAWFISLRARRAAITARETQVHQNATLLSLSTLYIKALYRIRPMQKPPQAATRAMPHLKNIARMIPMQRPIAPLTPNTIHSLVAEEFLVKKMVKRKSDRESVIARVVVMQIAVLNILFPKSPIVRPSKHMIMPKAILFLLRYLKRGFTENS
jgi:hypothetical protein